MRKRCELHAEVIFWVEDDCYWTATADCWEDGWKWMACYCFEEDVYMSGFSGVGFLVFDFDFWRIVLLLFVVAAEAELP